MSAFWSPMVEPPLPSEPDPVGEWWEEECIRTSGNLECEVCGMPYWKHPNVAKEAPTLVRACDGRLLKL